ncbi:Putative sulfate transporter YbaR [Seminavis robusta]|uniref:Sulfate transporter YbaR n=1 Tax=Seminavis robusta TaxID=568900 RepID=A0A9N8H8I9_9STRA|nr:Putative sulfate transporter YbaR [Seminavis robusta]|eukprot:Sro242_g096610.1 Putative sulfate transporter YbaR (653) ;mRNA; r:33985-35943
MVPLLGLFRLSVVGLMAVLMMMMGSFHHIHPVAAFVIPHSTLNTRHQLGGPLNQLDPFQQQQQKTKRKMELLFPLYSSNPNSTDTTSTSTSDSPPASQLESIIMNAKSLNPIRKLTSSKTKDSSSDEETPSDWKTSLATFSQASIAGLSVALAMVPEAVAFSFVAGVNPLVGLWTTVALGFTAAALGGRAGICSSASGACAVVVAGLCARHGPAYLSVCAIMAGLLQITGGLLGLGKFIRLVPHSVMLGFVNGLALVMTKAQLVHFQGMNPFQSAAGQAMYGITALTMILVKLLPRVLPFVPPTLGAVAISTLVAKLAKLPVKTLADVAGASTFKGGWSVVPQFAWWPPKGVPFSLETLKIVFPVAATMAAVGCIESLLTMQLLDGMVDDGKRGSTRKECVGQGAGNVMAGLFGGIGGCALLGQSIINVQSGGGVSRWSGMSMALFLGIGIVAAAPLLGAVPVASLVGVMLLVCQSTFSWSSLRLLRKIPVLDVAVIALVSVVTVQRDLAQAVLAGTIASALGFAWKQSTRLTATSETNKAGEEKYYRLQGPLFFGSTQQFQSLFDCQNDPKRIILDFADSRVMDHSALEAIHSLADAYGSVDKTVTLRRLSPDCAKLLARMYRSGKLPPYEIVESDPNTDPEYGLAVNYNQ